MLTDLTPKSQNNYSCIKCNYYSNKKSEWERHIITRKHCSLTPLTTTQSQKTPKKNKKTHYICYKCSKEYKSREGLWYHDKKCLYTSAAEPTIDITNVPEEVNTLTNMVKELMKSNNELQKQLVDICKNTTTTNISNTNSHNNSHNKTFNLQFFLNEQCKDAMNISDFANSFDLQLSDLESVGDLGYIEGITKIIIDKLNTMDIYKRPMHCSDAKREILYIKDENKWAKEPRNNPKLRHAIKTVSFKSMKLTNLWSDTYPESKNGDSRLNDKYMKLIKESTGGNGEIGDSENKIIRRIAKEIIIEKV